VLNLEERRVEYRQTSCRACSVSSPDISCSSSRSSATCRCHRLALTCAIAAVRFHHLSINLSHVSVILSTSDLGIGGLDLTPAGLKIPSQGRWRGINRDFNGRLRQANLPLGCFRPKVPEVAIRASRLAVSPDCAACASFPVVFCRIGVEDACLC
jgi:hypothetical protein